MSVLLYSGNVLRRFWELCITVRRTILEQFIYFHIIHCWWWLDMSFNSWTVYISYVYIHYFPDAIQQVHTGTSMRQLRTLMAKNLEYTKTFYRRRCSGLVGRMMLRRATYEKKRSAAKAKAKGGPGSCKPTGKRTEHDAESSASSSEDEKNSHHVHSASKRKMTSGTSPKSTIKNNKSSKGDKHNKSSTPKNIFYRIIDRPYNLEIQKEATSSTSSTYIKQEILT